MNTFKPAVLLLFLLVMGCNGSLEVPQQSNVSNSAQKQKPARALDVNMVLRSTDGGETWQDISEGLPAPLRDNKPGRNVSFANDSGFYLAVGNVLYHNKPNAAAPFWIKENFPGDHASITSVKTRMIAYNYAGGIFQKIKGRSAWSPIYSNFQQKNIRSVSESAAGSIFIGTDGGLFKSADRGKTWKEVQTGGWTMKILESNRVLMGTNTDGIIRSTDDGEHWDWVVNEQRRGFTVDSIKDGFAVVFNKTRSDTRRVRTSYDGGKSWQPIDAGLPDGYNISSIIQVGENFFCGHPKGIFRSSDKGKTWKLLLPSINGKVFNLSVSGNVIYARPSSGC
jgi:photosystem II stability/assembly factor-like uncharacterized protein